MSEDESQVGETAKLSREAGAVSGPAAPVAPEDGAAATDAPLHANGLPGPEEGPGDGEGGAGCAGEAADGDGADEAAAGAGPDAEGAYRLPAAARPPEVEALADWLRAAPADGPLVLDASAVESVSTPCVLAIVAAARSRAEAGAPAALRSPSPAFVDAFSDLGLFGDLMQMEIRP